MLQRGNRSAQNILFTAFTTVRQYPCDIVISSLRRNLKGARAPAILYIYIRTMLDKQAYDLQQPTLYCAKQWRVAVVVLGIYIGTVFEQCPSYMNVLELHGYM